MKPIISSIYSPELPYYGVDVPGDLYNFYIIMHVDICADGDSSVESFTFHVTTDLYGNCLLKKNLSLPRAVIVVDFFSWKNIEDAVKNICAGIDEPDWCRVRQKLLEWFDIY